MRNKLSLLAVVERFRGRRDKISGPRQSFHHTGLSSPSPWATTDDDSQSRPFGCTKGWSHLKNLKRLTALLAQVTTAFGPLKEVFDELVECIEFYESEADDRSEYVVLRNELEELFKDLERWACSTSPTITPCIVSLSKTIKKELDCVLRQQRKGVSLREKKSDTMLLSYRRIQMHLQRLSCNMNLSAWEAMEQHIADARLDRIFTRLDRLSPSLSAYYNSTQGRGLNRRAYTSGTRVNALAHIMSWVQYSPSGGVYWLNGMAGTGKTTIAYSLCEELDIQCKLAASFFCSRMLPECRDANLILPSIAYQLAHFSLPFKFALSKVLERDPDVHTRLPQVQFDALLVKPLLEVRATLPNDLVVVVDGLDECKDEEHTGHVLDVLLTGLLNLPIKFIISSRPEPEIRGWMGCRASTRMVLHELDKCAVQADIETYLRAELGYMNLLEPQISALVQRAGILFIYASTVVRYIKYRKFCPNPHARLDAVLNASNSSETAPNTEIDRLYATILEAALNDRKINQLERSDMKQVLDTVICAQEPLKIDTLSNLLQLYDRGRVLAALDPMWSVLHVDEATEIVTPLHISFPEYILDPTRSKQHHCDLGLHSQILAQLCFDCIRGTNPQFNICRLESSHVFDEQVENLELRVQEYISSELFYACRYWGHHLHAANGAKSLSNQLEDFLSNRLLLWLEVLNLRKTIRFVGKSVNFAELWCERHGFTGDLIELARDCWRFASTWTLNPISRSTPHIYISMLPFWSKSSPIGWHYLKRMQGMIRVEGTAMLRHHLAPLATWRFKGLNAASSSPDGTSIALSLGSRLFVADAFSGRMAVGPFIGHARDISAIAFSPDGAYIASGSKDCTLRVWHAQNGEIAVGPLHGHAGELTSVKYSPSGSRIVSGARDTTVRVWDPLSGTALLVLEGHTAPVLSVTFISSGTFIASCSADKTIRIWDAQSGVASLEPLEGHTDSVTCIISSPKGLLVSGSSDKTIRVWNVQTGEQVLDPLKGHTSAVTCIVFSPDGTRIVSSSHDCCIRVWDAETGDMIFGQLQGHTSAVSWIAFSPKGTRMISGGARDNTICVWDAQMQTAWLQPQREMIYPITSVGISSDATQIVTGAKCGAVTVRNIRNGEVVIELPCSHASGVMSVGISPDGSLIGWGCGDSSLFVWEVYGQKQLGPFLGHHSAVSFISFTPDSTRIVSKSDSLIHIHDARSGKLILTLHQPCPSLRHFGLSPDGTRIVTGSTDGSIYAWDTEKGHKLLGPLEGQSGPITSVAYSSDGTQIVSAFEDSNICVWNAQNGDMMLSLLGGGDNSPTSVAFSADGTHIASGFSDGTVFVHNAQTGNLILGPIQGHTKSVTMVGFLSSSAQVISHSHDGAIRIHDITKASISCMGRVLHLLLTQEPSRSEWKMNKDGWVMDAQSNLLCWVPSDLHANLMRQRTTGLISAMGNVCLWLDEARVGRDWTGCYIPGV